MMDVEGLEMKQVYFHPYKGKIEGGERICSDSVSTHSRLKSGMWQRD